LLCVLTHTWPGPPPGAGAAADLLAAGGVVDVAEGVAAPAAAPEAAAGAAAFGAAADGAAGCPAWFAGPYQCAIPPWPEQAPRLLEEDDQGLSLHWAVVPAGAPEGGLAAAAGAADFWVLVDGAAGC